MPPACEADCGVTKIRNQEKGYHRTADHLADAGKDCKFAEAHALHGKAYDIDKGQRNVKYHVDQQHLTRLVEDDRLRCIYKEKRNLAGPQKHNS